MAETRKVWSAEEKAAVVAHAKKHGPKAATEEFKVPATSMVNRWLRAAAGIPDKSHRKKIGRAAGRMRRWTPAKVAKVMAYLKEHGHHETLKHFRISGAQIHAWRQGMQSIPRRKANGAAPANGLDALPEHDALMWLERWRTAYLDRIKAETPLAADVLAALRSGK